jgi:hypothetical protein
MLKIKPKYKNQEAFIKKRAGTAEGSNESVRNDDLQRRIISGAFYFNGLKG